MTEVYEQTSRADLDILADVEAVIMRYPPLKNDRYHMDLAVVDGTVFISGHVKTMNTYSYLLNKVQQVEGVRGINTDYLFIDDLIRVQLGQVVPVGISVWVEYGTAVLSGRLPEGIAPEDVVANVATIPGVLRIAPAFGA